MRKVAMNVYKMYKNKKYFVWYNTYNLRTIIIKMYNFTSIVHDFLSKELCLCCNSCVHNLLSSFLCYHTFHSRYQWENIHPEIDRMVRRSNTC